MPEWNELQPIDLVGPDGVPQVTHCFRDDRVTMTRGVGAWARMLEMCGVFDDANFAQAVKAMMASMVVWEHKLGPDGDAKDPTYGGRETRPDGRNREERIDQMKPGMVVRTRGEEELVVRATNVTAGETLTHLQFLINLMSVNLGIPLMEALLNGDVSNFAGARMARDAAKLGWKRCQKMLIHKRCRPDYRRRLANALRRPGAFGRGLRRAEARLGEAIFGLEIIAPRWPYQQPLHDAQADDLKLQNGTASKRQIVAESSGRDLDDVTDEDINDTTRAILKAMNSARYINQQYPQGDPVTWRDIYRGHAADVRPRPAAGGDESRPT
jgi:capsid protein